MKVGDRAWRALSSRVKREEPNCWLCHEPIDPNIAYPDDMCHSLDHVVPRKFGGPHTRENVRAAHLICNKRRGAADPPKDRPQSFNW